MDEAIDVNAPFSFRVEDVFSITGKGRLFAESWSPAQSRWVPRRACLWVIAFCSDG
jgi:hypothetical protein